MFALVLLLVCAGALALPQNTKPRPVYDLDQAEELFEKFIVDFDKHYASRVEKQTRFEIFKDKLRYINNRNTDPTETAEFGITVFTDIHVDELAEYNGFNLKLMPEDVIDNIVHISGPVNGDLPENFDWRDHGAVTPVKDQRSCGACWAFSSVASVESAYAIKHQRLISLSEQQLVDCSKKNYGCRGGHMVPALEYLKGAGSDTEESYPYEEEQFECRHKSAKVGAKVTDFTQYNLTDEDALRKLLVEAGPIAVAIDSTDLDQHTGPGIIKKCTFFSLNHGVLLVGYGTAKDGTKYWTIKNSYGPHLGDGGFQSFARGGNPCGILNDNACSPKVA